MVQVRWSLNLIFHGHLPNSWCGKNSVTFNILHHTGFIITGWGTVFFWTWMTKQFTYTQPAYQWMTNNSHIHNQFINEWQTINTYTASLSMNDKQLTCTQPCLWEKFLQRNFHCPKLANSIAISGSKGTWTYPRWIGAICAPPLTASTPHSTDKSLKYNHICC